MKQNKHRPIYKIVKIYSTDYNLFEKNSLPNPLWISKEIAEDDLEKKFLLKYPAEKELLMSGQIDFIVVIYYDEELIKKNSNI